MWLFQSKFSKLVGFCSHQQTADDFSLLRSQENVYLLSLKKFDSKNKPKNQLINFPLDFYRYFFWVIFSGKKMFQKVFHQIWKLTFGIPRTGKDGKIELENIESQNGVHNGFWKKREHKKARLFYYYILNQLCYRTTYFYGICYVKFDLNFFQSLL